MNEEIAPNGNSGIVPCSPTGTPIIPAKFVPYVLAASTIFTVLGAQFALPGPWTPERYFVVGALVLNTLLSGASVGLRR